LNILDWVMKTWAGFSVATGDLVHMQYPHGHRLATSGLKREKEPMYKYNHAHMELTASGCSLGEGKGGIILSRWPG
jgi:hypothetical protein